MASNIASGYSTDHRLPMAFSGNMGHGHQHSPGYCRITDPDMTFRGSSDYGHEHGFRWHPRTCMAFGGNLGQGHQHDFQLWRIMDIWMNLRLQHGLGQWFIDTKVASSGSTDHSDLLRRFNPENELFFILDILFKRNREIV